MILLDQLVFHRDSQLHELLIDNSLEYGQKKMSEKLKRVRLLRRGSIYLDLARIFLLLRFNLRIRFFRHLARILYF